ncbi:hypothetical protein DMA11_06280 [Marinilabiliaceae bacterium JC017]|nr:hypothetical protein DMA11_06280 [Marinilabiliaceae bacterium JC017]
MDQQTVRDVINKQVKDVSWSEIRSMGLEVFPRLIMAVQVREGSCQECQRIYNNLNLYLKDIKSVVRGSQKERRLFELEVDGAFKHLKRSHGVVPKGKILSLFIFLGIIIGIFIGWLFHAFMAVDLIGAIVLGWFLGMTAGWIGGKIKEYRLNKSQRLF